MIFGNFEGAGFDHDDRLVGAGHDQVHLAELLIGDRWVHDELAVEQTDAHAGDRVHERNLGDVQGSRGGSDADHVGIIFAIGGENLGDDLSFVRPAFGKQGAQGAVGQTGGQNFLFRGASFALEKSSGNLARGVGELAVVDGQRQKVFVGCFRIHAGRGQHDGVAITGHDCAVRLTSHLARLKRQSAPAHFQTDLFKHHFTSF